MEYLSYTPLYRTLHTYWSSLYSLPHNNPLYCVYYLLQCLLSTGYQNWIVWGNSRCEFMRKEPNALSPRQGLGLASSSAPSPAPSLASAWALVVALTLLVSWSFGSGSIPHWPSTVAASASVFGIPRPSVMCHNGTSTVPPPLVAAPTMRTVRAAVATVCTPSQNGRFGLLCALAPFCANNKCQLLSLTNKKKATKLSRKKRQGREVEVGAGAGPGKELMMLPHASHWRPQWWWPTTDYTKRVPTTGCPLSFFPLPSTLFPLPALRFCRSHCQVYLALPPALCQLLLFP